MRRFWKIVRNNFLLPSADDIFDNQILIIAIVIITYFLKIYLRELEWRRGADGEEEQRETLKQTPH